MSERPIRVLVVDDSAFARKVLVELLRREPGVEVVGIARDGLDALEQITDLKPDVVTLDLMMPGLDGLGVLRALPIENAPRVVVVSSTDAETELGLAALDAGAIELVHKPTALATDRLYEVASDLARAVRGAAAARPRESIVPAAPPTRAHAATAPGGHSPAHRGIIVVGASTGGPQALTRLLSSLPGDLPVPVALALHIPMGFTEALARRLDAASALEVVEAWDGVELKPGRAVIARGGMHLKVERAGASAAGVARTDLLPLATAHRPSVDVLFASAAQAWGAGAIGVVLTGMGSDGLEGSRAIRAAGGAVLTETEASCVVYGMPRSVVDAGLSSDQASIESMAAALVARVVPTPR